MQRQVTFRGVAPSAAIVEEVARQAEKLARNLPLLTTCQVVVEAENVARRGPGVRVALRVYGAYPRGPVCSSVHSPHSGDLRSSVRSVFGAAWRQFAARGRRRDERFAA